MNRSFSFIAARFCRSGRAVLVLCALLSAQLSLFQLALAQEPTQAYVQVRTAVLRKGPQQWASAISQLAYGSEVRVVESGGDPWLVVKASNGDQGFLHRSALSSQKIVFLKTATKTDLNDASMSNVVLAGKGFSQDVEDLYSKNNPTIDLKLLDQIEKQNFTTRRSLGEFVQRGKLSASSMSNIQRDHTDAHG